VREEKRREEKRREEKRFTTELPPPRAATPTDENSSTYGYFLSRHRGHRGFTENEYLISFRRKDSLLREDSVFSVTPWFKSLVRRQRAKQAALPL
jgi:hypothetical protein